MFECNCFLCFPDISRKPQINDATALFRTQEPRHTTTHCLPFFSVALLAADINADIGGISLAAASGPLAKWQALSCIAAVACVPGHQQNQRRGL